MKIDTGIDVIYQHPWGVKIESHYGRLIYIGGEGFTDIHFYFTGVAVAVGKVIGLHHLIYKQTNEVME